VFLFASLSKYRLSFSAVALRRQTFNLSTFFPHHIHILLFCVFYFSRLQFKFLPAGDVVFSLLLFSSIIIIIFFFHYYYFPTSGAVIFLFKTLLYFLLLQ